MKNNSPLTGKTALFSGDSISFGSSDREGRWGWAKRIERQYGLQADNLSMSGWSLSTIRTGRMLDQLYNAPEKLYDYVILHGGVNDAWGDGTVYAPVGRMTDGYCTADFDVTTYAGALEELFCFTYEKYPAARVGYIINFATPEASSIGHLRDMEEYYAEGIKICQKWGVHYLDLYHDTYVNNTVMEVHTNRYMADAVHPNAAGYERLYPIIGDWMETLPPNQKDFTVIHNRHQRQTALTPVAWQGTHGTLLTPKEEGLFLQGQAPYGQHDCGVRWVGAAATATLEQPADLSDARVMEFEFYLGKSLYGKPGQLQLDLFSSQGQGISLYFGIDFHAQGWHRGTFDLAEPRFRVGEPDLAHIRQLAFTWWNHNACVENMEVAIRNIRYIQ